MSDRDRVNGDPVFLSRPSHENRFSQRKGRYDSGLTPTESRTKERLMRQFLQRDGQQGNSTAYLEAECWCACGKLRAEDSRTCGRCA